MLLSFETFRVLNVLGFKLYNLNSLSLSPRESLAKGREGRKERNEKKKRGKRREKRRRCNRLINVRKEKKIGVCSVTCIHVVSDREK